MHASILDCQGPELRGRSVVLMTESPLTTGVALLELDGIAARVTICTQELSLNSLASVVEATAADAIVTDLPESASGHPGIRRIVPNIDKLVSVQYDRDSQLETEWVVLTSGTMGPPKLLAHTLSSLIGAIDTNRAAPRDMVWGTLYDTRRFGGMQVFLRAAVAGCPLVLPSLSDSTADFLERAGSAGITHISGTPSQWRRVLMSRTARCIAPGYVRLSGEAVDQALLNRLRETYPQARIVHAFGSSEAGTVFEVTDGADGFPVSTLRSVPGVDMKIESGTLRVRSGRTASRFLGKQVIPLKDAEGFVDTGDLIERRGDRYFFVGRRDGRMNVGGLKVYPEEVEAVVHRHPKVSMCRVYARENPVTGSIVIADVVLKEEESAETRIAKLEQEIRQICHDALPAHKTPAMIRVVPSLRMSPSGKMARD
ncbi:MAG TPA: fatty acid--CoA ligase family protein [Acidobacteriaceae bacterium]|nr:fatty acid--CoA ligase family protein [Acidobacteriaceae bacterium]